jgi:MoaA/NifB/PqqE/SkfB family radical SAM enzyme
MRSLVQYPRVLRITLGKKPALRSVYHAVRFRFSQMREAIGTISQGYRDPADPWKRFYYVNPARHGEKLKKGNFYRPLILQLETVNTCNNLCIICAYEPHDRPKSIMSLKVFEKVLRDYSDLGGGYLSLTPVTGDILMDKHLLARLEMIKRYPAITEVGVTTNAAMLDRFSDDEVRIIVNSLGRIQISIYGVDEEEYFVMTKRHTYDRAIEGIRRILAVRTKNVNLAFRLLKQRSRQDVDDWITDVVGCKEPVTINSFMTRGYSNFTTLDTNAPLPFGATWGPARSNKAQCLIPLLAVQVSSNGDVGFCPCVGSLEGLRLGHIEQSSLAEIYNSPRTRALWDWSVDTPKPCKTCTFHQPLSTIRTNPSILDDPFPFFGA